MEVKNIVKDILEDKKPLRDILLNEEIQYSDILKQVEEFAKTIDEVSEAFITDDMVIVELAGFSEEDSSGEKRNEAVEYVQDTIENKFEAGLLSFDNDTDTGPQGMYPVVLVTLSNE